MNTPQDPPAVTPPKPERPKQKFTWVFWLIVAVIALAVAGIILATFAAGHVANRISNATPPSASSGQGGGALEQPNQTPYGGNVVPNTAYEDMTFDQILSTTGLSAGDASGSEFGAGVYKVGGDGIAPGFYYLGGSQSVQGTYQLFDRDDDANDRYDLDDSVIYFGNYFVTLEEGDVIAYKPGGDEKMHVQNQDPLGVTAPYQSGVYRVGVDIPEGSYTITVERESLDAATSESGAFVMRNLDFDDDSIVATAYVRVGGRQTVTVSAGQYLELYAAQAEPVAVGSGAATTPDQGQGQAQGSQNSGQGAYGSHHPETHHTALAAGNTQ